MAGDEHGVPVVVDRERLAHRARHRRDPGDGADPLGGAEEHLRGARLVVPDQAELGRKGDGSPGAEAEVDVLRMEDASRQQARGDEEYEGHRRLQDHQAIAQRPAASGSAASLHPSDPTPDSRASRAAPGQAGEGPAAVATAS
jgi:hypothetical protein